MSTLETELASKFWSVFFPRDRFHPKDNRLDLEGIFFKHFDRELEQNGHYKIDDSVMFDVDELSNRLPFPDFKSALINQPHEIIGCMGLALSIIRTIKTKGSDTRPFLPRFRNLSPATPYGELKSSTVGLMVSLRGYVVRISSCKPLIEEASFRCTKCLRDTWVRFEDGIFTPPSICHTEKCRNKYLELQRSTAKFIDYQRVKLQEVDDPSSAGGEEAARVPRGFEVELRGSLVDQCVPGIVVDVVGIVKALQSDASRGPRPGAGGRGMGRESGLHQLYLLVNSLVVRKGAHVLDEESSASTADSRPMEEDGAINFSLSKSPSSTAIETYARIRSIALCPDCLGLLAASLCPTILGQDLVKFGLLLALFGGTLRTEVAGPRSRSDVHVLMVGDPGLGKSQLLRAAAAVAPRSVYVCGNTATAAGLTVAVSREGRGGDMCIEAGALVLADQGVCCVDELDKLQCDPSALLEAMEQQRISIAKSGVVTALRSRTAVVAAANPSGGHYNRGKTVCENLKMPAALLSRFDLVFVLLDRADETRDRLISQHIMRARHDGETEMSAMGGVGAGWALGRETTRGEEDMTLTQRLRSSSSHFASTPIPLQLLRQYIAYARRYCHPRLTPVAAKVLHRLYLKMRTQASTGDAIPVTTRHLESLVRLAQARAKMELRTEVSECDARDVLQLLQESLLDSHTTDGGLVDTARRGGLSLAKQVKAMAKALAREAELRQSRMFLRQELEGVAARLGLSGGSAGNGLGLEGVIDVMRTEGYLLLKGPRLYQLQTS